MRGSREIKQKGGGRGRTIDGERKKTLPKTLRGKAMSGEGESDSPSVPSDGEE